MGHDSFEGLLWRTSESKRTFQKLSSPKNVYQDFTVAEHAVLYGQANSYVVVRQTCNTHFPKLRANNKS